MNRKYDEVKCIWADSGIIGYKLCDKNFDCENCDLDKVLKKTAVANTEIEENYNSSKNIFTKISSEIYTAKYEKQNLYLKNYLCLKNLFGDKYFLGISPLLYNIFLNSEGYFNCRKEYYVKEGDQVVDLTGQWGSISIASPLSLKVLKQIPQKNGDVNCTNWIGIVEVDNSERDSHTISMNEFEESKNFVVSLLKSKENDDIFAGITMYDGGKKITNLPDLLGQTEFCSFVNKILSDHK